MKEKREVLDWLSQFNYRERQADIAKKHLKGTGQWFVNAPRYLEWRSSSNKTLFCPGIPGAGKSVMMSLVIKHLSSELESNLSASAYLYYEYGRQTEQDVEHLLASLIQQLSEYQNSIHKSLQTLFDGYKKNEGRPTYEELTTVFSSISKSFDRVFIVIDALDECNENVRERLLRSIRKAQSGAEISLIVTSRRVPNVEDEFKEELHQAIEASEGDIETFLDCRIHEL